MGCGASSQEKYKAPPQVANPNQQEFLSFLSQVPLFRQLPEDQHYLLADACTVRQFKQGEVVMSQGTIGCEFFVIRNGEAAVAVAKEAASGSSEPPKKVATLKKGDFFGEQALLHDVPRTATITAETALDTLQITRAKFRELGLNDKLQFQHRKAVVGGVKTTKTQAVAPSKKTPEERAMIAEALRKNDNLQVMVPLDDDRVQAMVDICWKEHIKAGTEIIKEGDITADYFYVVADGAFDVSQATDRQQSAESSVSKMSRSKSLRLISEGGSFGEMALLCLMPRSATVKAQLDSVVWVFGRNNFKSILMKVSEAHVARYVTYLDKVEILASLLPDEKKVMAQALLEMHYDKNEVIIEQGQQGTSFYILYEGEVVVMKDGQEIRRLTANVDPKSNEPAKFFGELALLNNAPRTATVKVVSKTVKVLVLDRDSFDYLLGPLEELIAASKEMGTRTAKPVGKPKLEVTRKRDKILRTDLTKIGLLGCGGFGAVELFEHKQTKECYAMKSLSKGFVVKTGTCESVITEKDILLLCDSIFIIQLYETYNSKENLFFLMEAAMGGELYATYQKKGFHGSPQHAKFYSAGVICAFVHLHQHKVLYRDLKPENILMNEVGHVKLTDMGLAKISVGMTYTVCGTPDYFAPELIDGTGHHVGVDWWTLGVLIYELMSGAPPFEANDPMQTYKKVRKGIGVVQFPSDCKGAVENLIRGLLTSDPSMRLPMLQGGIEKNLEQHEWFSDLDWVAFKELKLTPPYVPSVKGKRDMRNFNANKADLPPQIPYVDDGTGWDKGFATVT